MSDERTAIDDEKHLCYRVIGGLKQKDDNSDDIHGDETAVELSDANLVLMTVA